MLSALPCSQRAGAAAAAPGDSPEGSAAAAAKKCAAGGKHLLHKSGINARFGTELKKGTFPAQTGRTVTLDQTAPTGSLEEMPADDFVGMCNRERMNKTFANA